MRVCITIFNCTFLGVYCSGWVKTGPIGVIVSTMNSSFETGSNLLSDINRGAIDGTVSKPGRNLIVNDILKKKGVCVVDVFAAFRVSDSYQFDVMYGVFRTYFVAFPIKCDLQLFVART